MVLGDVHQGPDAAPLGFGNRRFRFHYSVLALSTALFIVPDFECCVLSEVMSLDFGDWVRSIGNPKYVSTEDRFNTTVDLYYGAMSRLKS